MIEIVIPSDEIVISKLDHEGNIFSWIQLAENSQKHTCKPRSRRRAHTMELAIFSNPFYEVADLWDPRQMVVLMSTGPVSGLSALPHRRRDVRLCSLLAFPHALPAIPTQGVSSCQCLRRGALCFFVQ
jgi:hypothetical protein